jgi:hypothetical protein
VDAVDGPSVFIVRMWPDGVARGAWRGSVDDVARKRRVYFTDLGTLCEFIAEQRRLPAPASEHADVSERS